MTSTVKPGDLVGFNVECTAPNGYQEHHMIRETNSGELLRLVTVVVTSYSERGWTVATHAVEAIAGVHC